MFQSLEFGSHVGHGCLWHVLIMHHKQVQDIMLVLKTVINYRQWSSVYVYAELFSCAWLWWVCVNFRPRESTWLYISCISLIQVISQITQVYLFPIGLVCITDWNIISFSSFGGSLLTVLKQVVSCNVI